MGNSFRHQMDLLNLLKNRLLQLNEALDYMTVIYNAKIEELKSSGMYEEPYQKFKNQYMYQTNTQMKKISSEIEEQDLRFIDKIIERIEPLL